MKLFEILNKVYPYKWTSTNPAEAIAEFTATSGKIKVMFALGDNPLQDFDDPYDEDECILITFELMEADHNTNHDDHDGEEYDEYHDEDSFDMGKMDITNTGDAFAIFATVKTIISEYLQHHKPPMVAFSAEEPSRVKLYARFAQMFKKDGWIVNGGHGRDGETAWTMKKRSHVNESRDYTKAFANKRNPEIKIYNMMDKTNWGKKKRTSAKDVIVKDSKTGNVYGRRTIIQKDL